MFKKTILFAFFCLLGAAQASNCFGDSIIIKYQSGKTQVINLEEGAKSIYSMQIQINQSLNETSANKTNEKTPIKTDQAENSNIQKTPQTKSSSKVIDVGNGIKIRWVTPNPYGADY